MLRSFGCSEVMRSATTEAAAGVLQGRPVVCSSVSVDELVRMLERRIGLDGFLGASHTVVPG